MGSFSYLSIANYPVFDRKAGYHHDIANLIFLPEDFIVEERPRSTMNKLYWGEGHDDENEKYQFIGFRQSVKVCRKRLEIYGASIEKCKEDFEQAKDYIDKEGLYNIPIRKISFKKYLKEIQTIIREGIRKDDDFYNDFRDFLVAGNLCIDGQTINNGLFCILSTLNDEEIVEYDLSDGNGYGVTEYDSNGISFEKIIILTEGKTDAEFISGSLKNMYPYLYPYYHFMDFEGFKVEGSASALVKMINAFAAAKVKHPIIALFDNDTAGVHEMNRLRISNLPANIKVLKLPNVQLAVNYPTLGPTGLKKMNVNGLACGIEMYLGEDILKISDSHTPVRWKEFNENIGKYHGALVEKDSIQRKFREKIRNGNLGKMDEMDLLLNQVFNAFSMAN